MTELNYARQAFKFKDPILSLWNTDLLETYGSLYTRNYMQKVFDLCVDKSVVRFILPENGRFLDDKFSAMDDDHIFRLPYPLISIEAPGSGHLMESERLLGKVPVEKILFFAMEISDFRSDFIKPFLRRNDFDDNGFSDDEINGSGPFCIGIFSMQYCSERHYTREFWQPSAPFFIRNIFRRNSDGLPLIDYKNSTRGVHVEDMHFELFSLFGLLNALQCSNVSIADFRKEKQVKKSHGGIPFSSYKVLTVSSHKSKSSGEALSGTHASPREHLRRGHIRRLSNKKIWINSMIVNAGSTFKIKKDYKI